MSRRPITAPPRNPPLAGILPGDIVLTDADIRDLGLEQAPADFGPSVEEIMADRAEGKNHG